MLKNFLALFFVAFFSGCNVYGPEELDRLIKEDPIFKQMIASRDQVHSQIRLIKDDLLTRKKSMDGQIEKLRNEFDIYSREQNQKIQKLETIIEASRAALRKDIEAAEEEMEAKSKELKDYLGTYNDIRQLGRSKGITIPQKEKQVWQERLLELSEKINRLNERVQELKLQIRLKKQKISFLK